MKSIFATFFYRIEKLETFPVMPKISRFYFLSFTRINLRHKKCKMKVGFAYSPQGCRLRGPSHGRRRPWHTPAPAHDSSPESWRFYWARKRTGHGVSRVYCHTHTTNIKRVYRQVRNGKIRRSSRLARNGMASADNARPSLRGPALRRPRPGESNSSRIKLIFVIRSARSTYCFYSSYKIIARHWSCFVINHWNAILTRLYFFVSFFVMSLAPSH